MSVKHKVQTLAIRCIDFRVQVGIDDDLQKNGLRGNVDNIALAGAALNTDEVLQHTDISFRLHAPDEVRIYQHEDCGAYAAIGDPSRERKREDAQKLEQRLKEINPNIIVKTLYAKLDGTIEEL